MTNEMPRYDTDDDDVIEADVDNAKTTTGQIGNAGSPIELADALRDTSGDVTGDIDIYTHDNLADQGKVALDPSPIDTGNEAMGTYYIRDPANRAFAIISVEGQGLEANIVFDPANSFTTTEGNDGTFNVYWDSGNSQYELNNENGQTRDFLVIALRGER